MPFMPFYGQLYLGGLLLFDTSLLTQEATEIEQARTAYLTPLEQLYFADVGRRIREDTFNTYAVGNFAYGEGLGSAFSFDLNHIPAESLNPLLVPFNDFIVYHDVITGAEIWEFPV